MLLCVETGTVARGTVGRLLQLMDQGDTGAFGSISPSPDEISAASTSLPLPVVEAWPRPAPARAGCGAPCPPGSRGPRWGRRICSLGSPSIPGRTWGKALSARPQADFSGAQPGPPGRACCLPCAGVRSWGAWLPIRGRLTPSCFTCPYPSLHCHPSSGPALSSLHPLHSLLRSPRTPPFQTVRCDVQTPWGSPTAPPPRLR